MEGRRLVEVLHEAFEHVDEASPWSEWRAVLHQMGLAERLPAGVPEPLARLGALARRSEWLSPTRVRVVLMLVPFSLLLLLVWIGVLEWVLPWVKGLDGPSYWDTDVGSLSFAGGIAVALLVMGWFAIPSLVRWLGSRVSRGVERPTLAQQAVQKLRWTDFVVSDELVSVVNHPSGRRLLVLDAWACQVQDGCDRLADTIEPELLAGLRAACSRLRSELAKTIAAANKERADALAAQAGVVRLQRVPAAIEASAGRVDALATKAESWRRVLPPLPASVKG